MPAAYEYHYTHFPYRRIPGAVPPGVRMNEIARDGWELVSASWETINPVEGVHHLYWRRPVPPPGTDTSSET
jgi:hypothetical protein